MGEVSREQVQEYLGSHPGFVRRYFLENVGQDELETWIQEENMTKKTASLNHYGRNNSITLTTFQDMVNGRRTKDAFQRRSNDELMNMSEIDMFMELIRDVANELDVNVLCYKILLNVKILTLSDRGSLFLAKGSGENKYLVSKLFDVTETSTLEDSLHTEETQIRVPFGKGIAGSVALTKSSINIKDAYQDPRFNKEVDKKTGYRTKNLLCMPILNYEGDLVGVAQIMNKGNGEAFTKADEEMFRNYLTFCGIGLTNAQLFEMSVMEYKRNQMLLRLARGIFAEQSNLDKLVQRIMLESQEILKCHRCCVYLIDSNAKELQDFVHLDQTKDAFEEFKNHVGSPSSEQESKLLRTKSRKHGPFLAAMQNTEPMKPEQIMFQKGFELHGDNGDISIPSMADMQKSKSVEMARWVAASGQMKNLADASVDSAYGFEIEDYDGFKIRSLLSVPIRNSEHSIIGVVQLMNKFNGKPFTEVDINIVEAFAIFCGLGIHNCQMYESACKLMAKQSVALEVLSYHATASQEDVERLKDAPIPTGDDYRLYRYDFNDFPLSEDDTCKATVRMFMDMDIINAFQIPYDVLCRWTLSVKKNYRPVTYHNWRHAFNVAQTMFTMLYTGKMVKYMDNLEIFALVVACLCHDLDHRGTNNAFQSKVDSPLATLYSTSTMEHHHFDQCIMILNSEGNNIFMSLNAADYKRVIGVLESAILSTDLALYFKKRGSFEHLVKEGEAHWKDSEKRDLLRGMMMTACDVAAITKPWEVQREVAQLVASEFFEQGDIERDQLHEEPIAMMDRRKKEELPKMQVGFIDAICIPIYKLLSDEFDGLTPLFDGVTNNRKQWEILREENATIDVEQELEPLFAGCQNNRFQWQSLADSIHKQEPKNFDPPPQNNQPQNKSADLVVADKNSKNTSAGTKHIKPTERILNEQTKNSTPSPEARTPVKTKQSATCAIL